MVENSLLLLLREGRIPPLSKLSELAENFHLLSPKEQTTLIVFGRKIPEVRKVLETKLPLEEKLKKTLLEREIVEVPIPVVDKISKTGKLSKVFLIKNAPLLWTNLKEKLNPLKSKLKPLVETNFIVLFEEKYEGYSFLLPLAVALKNEKLLRDFCFTGNIDSDGNLLPVEGLKEKEKICKSLGKILITPEDFKNLFQLLEFLESSPKKIPLLLSASARTEETLKRDFENLTNSAKVKILPKENFYRRVFKTPPYAEFGRLQTPDDWQKALDLFGSFLKAVDSTFRDSEIHLTLIGPSSLAFAFGITHGCHKRAVFYHYQGGRYYPVVVIDESNSRLLKGFVSNPERVKEKFVPYEGKEKPETLAVVLDFVAHPLVGSVKSFLKRKGFKADILILEHKEKANFDPNRLWIDDIAETFTLIRNYKEKYPYEELLFFFGTPVAFAFGLGCAIGHFFKGRIFNFSPKDNSYEEVFRIDEIEKVR